MSALIWALDVVRLRLAAAAFHAPDGATRAVFVTSDAPHAVTAVLLAGDAKHLRDPLTGEHLRVDAGRVSVPLQSRGVRLLIPE